MKFLTLTAILALCTIESQAIRVTQDTSAAYNGDGLKAILGAIIGGDSTPAAPAAAPAASHKKDCGCSNCGKKSKGDGGKGAKMAAHAAEKAIHRAVAKLEERE